MFPILTLALRPLPLFHTRFPMLKTRTLLIAALLLSMSAATVYTAEAQVLRPEKTWSFTPRVGLSHYFGDVNPNLSGFSYVAGAEIGYAFKPTYSVNMFYQFGGYPAIDPNTDFAAYCALAPGSCSDYTQRFAGGVFARFTPKGVGSKVAPFFDLGLGASDAVGASFAVGAVLGAGLDVALNNRTSFLLGLQTFAPFVDGHLDGHNDKDPGGLGSPSAGGPFDFLTGLNAGVRFSLKAACTPVQIVAINGPSSLHTGTAGTFSGETNLATQPVEIRWDFGDGNTAAGMPATHTFGRAGSFTVTMTASNACGMDSRTLAVNVTNPPVPAAIVSVNATPNPSVAGQVVNFSVNARGDSPISYTWNFGDGSTGTGANPNHTYTRPGTYTVTVTASNAAGSDSRTMTVTVNAPAPTCTIAELNSAFFARNSSALSSEAMAQLNENIQVLNSAECANMNLRLEGFAAPGERNAQRLSEDRARAVMQYYVNNGVAASRLTMQGNGVVGGTTSKKDDTARFRRVDSIPVR